MLTADELHLFIVECMFTCMVWYVELIARVCLEHVYLLLYAFEFGEMTLTIKDSDLQTLQTGGDCVG